MTQKKIKVEIEFLEDEENSSIKIYADSSKCDIILMDSENKMEVAKQLRKWSDQLFDESFK